MEIDGSGLKALILDRMVPMFTADFSTRLVIQQHNKPDLRPLAASLGAIAALACHTPSPWLQLPALNLENMFIGGA